MRQNTVVRQQMFEYIEQWQKSGLSQKSFCHRVKLSYHIFHYWYKLYRSKEGQSVAPSFIRIEPSEPSLMSQAELIFPDGKRLIFHQPVSANYLKALIG